MVMFHADSRPYAIHSRGKRRASCAKLSASFAQQGGFTLLEVMVALAVFATMAAGMAMVIQNGVGLTERLENKTLAHWVAENQLMALRAEYRGRNVRGGSDQRRTVEYGEREWVTTTTMVPSATLSGFVEVTVAVALVEAEDDQLAEVFTFLGQAR